MKIRQIIIGLMLVSTCGAVGAAEDFSAKRLVYQDTTEDVVEYSESTILRQENGYSIEYREQDTLVSTTHCDSSLEVQRYKVHRDGGTTLTFERDGKTINAQDGSTQMTKKIGNEPWNQSIIWFNLLCSSYLLRSIPLGVGATLFGIAHVYISSVSLH